MDSESQDATKITSALAEPRMYSSVKMITQDMHMNGMNIVLSISPFFFFFQCCGNVDIKTSLVSAWQAIRTRNQFMKITIARSLETLTAVKKSNTILTLKVKVKKMNGQAQKPWCPLLDLSYHYSIGRVLLGFMEALDSASFLATCLFAMFIALVERETSTKHVWRRRISRPWLDEGCDVPRFL